MPPKPPKKPRNPKTDQHINKIKGSKKLSYKEARDAVVFFKELLVSGSVYPEKNKEARELFRKMQSTQKDHDLLYDFYQNIMSTLSVKRISGQRTKKPDIELLKSIIIPAEDDVKSKKAKLRAVARGASQKKAAAAAIQAQRNIPVSLESLAVDLQNRLSGSNSG